MRSFKAALPAALPKALASAGVMIVLALGTHKAHAQTDYARAYCAAQWAGDFAAQERCMNRQYEAMQAYMTWMDEVHPIMLAEVERRPGATQWEHPLAQINAHCESSWLGEGDADKDFAAMMRCVDRQRAALERLSQ